MHGARSVVETSAGARLATSDKISPATAPTGDGASATARIAAGAMSSAASTPQVAAPFRSAAAAAVARGIPARAARIVASASAATRTRRGKSVESRTAAAVGAPPDARVDVIDATVARTTSGSDGTTDFSTSVIGMSRTATSRAYTAAKTRPRARTSSRAASRSVRARVSRSVAAGGGGGGSSASSTSAGAIVNNGMRSSPSSDECDARRVGSSSASIDDRGGDGDRSGTNNRGAASPRAGCGVRNNATRPNPLGAVTSAGSTMTFFALIASSPRSATPNVRSIHAGSPLETTSDSSAARCFATKSSGESHPLGTSRSRRPTSSGCALLNTLASS